MTDALEPGAFRTALQDWLAENDLTPPVGMDSLDKHQAQHLRVLKALYDAGWIRYGWPEWAGGLGGPDILRAIVGEEIVGRGIDHPGPYATLDLLTRTMIDHAPPELTAEMVPRLLSGQESWCRGFAEAGAGSDLAALTTRAVQRGDTWVISGQKSWAGLAQYATRCILLARTGAPDIPDRQAITAFLVDLETPGVTVRPLPTMHDVDEFCEVVFDDVAVPAARMIGAPGDGWKLAMDLLIDERSTCFWQRIAHLYSRFDALIAEVKNQGQVIDSDMGEVYLALHTLRCRSRATQHSLGEGHHPGPNSSIDKVLLADAEQRLYDTARDLMPGAIELDDTPWRTEYLYSRAATIYGGTAEVQRDIIARRLLDLGQE